MSVKKETSLQQRVQKVILARGGYGRKNHGNMITVKGLSDLAFTYKGLSLYFEVKTEEDATNVSEEQGIHCRKAKKAGAITAIISKVSQATYLLDMIDEYYQKTPTFHEWFRVRAVLHEIGDWDDGTSY